MKRIWYNPVIDYASLVDGNKYYVRLYEYEFVAELMTFDQSVNSFKSITTSEPFLYTVVNRVSLFV